MRPLLQAPELEPYLDEPPQLASGSPGKIASLHMKFEARTHRSILAELYRQAPLIVHRALYWDEEMPGLPCVFIISNAGGILQGDRNTIAIEMAPGSYAHVTTQSATKIQSMDANFASQIQEIICHEDSYLEYLPDPMIPHTHTRFLQDTIIRIAPSATLLYSEILMAGRKHYDELYQYDVFSSTVLAERMDGRKLFREKYVVRPLTHCVRRNGEMGHYDVFGNAIFLTPKVHADRVFAQVPACINTAEQWAAGASRLPNDAGLIYKVVGMESAVVRAKLRDFWALVRQEVVGAAIPREFAWR